MSDVKKALKLDKYECGVIFQSLNDKRNKMIEEAQPTDAVDDVLLKVIDLMEQPTEKGKRGYRYREER